MSHDYQPHWDYPTVELDEVQCLSAQERRDIEHVIARVRSRLVPALGFESEEITVFFVEPDGLGIDTVALYCNGTSSRPVVGFDLESKKRLCQEEGLSLAHQFEVSLAHELAHAFQDSIGLGHEQVHGFDEDDAEAFGRAWADRGIIDLGLLEVAQRNEQACEPCKH